MRYSDLPIERLLVRQLKRILIDENVYFRSIYSRKADIVNELKSLPEGECLNLHKLNTEQHVKRMFGDRNSEAKRNAIELMLIHERFVDENRTYIKERIRERTQRHYRFLIDSKEQIWALVGDKSYLLPRKEIDAYIIKRYKSLKNDVQDDLNDEITEIIRRRREEFLLNNERGRRRPVERRPLNRRPVDLPEEPADEPEIQPNAEGDNFNVIHGLNRIVDNLYIVVRDRENMAQDPANVADALAKTTEDLANVIISLTNVVENPDNIARDFPNAVGDPADIALEYFNAVRDYSNVVIDHSNVVRNRARTVGNLNERNPIVIGSLSRKTCERSMSNFYAKPKKVFENDCPICQDPADVYFKCGHPIHISCVNRMIDSLNGRERLSRLKCAFCRDEIHPGDIKRMVYETQNKMYNELAYVRDPAVLESLSNCTYKSLITNDYKTMIESFDRFKEICEEQKE